MSGALVALPIHAIREVIPSPREYCPLPIAARGLRGAVNLRGDVIAVIDVDDAVGLAPSSAPRHAIVVMRWQGRLLGLMADEVCGVAEIAGTELFELTIPTAGRCHLVTHSFQLQQNVVSLLDPARIAALPDIPLSPERPADGASNESRKLASLLLFSVRGVHFGIEATCVDSTVARTRIERNALSLGYCLGSITHHGRDIPVVDTLAALQLGACAGAVESGVVILRFGQGGLLGFTADDVHDIARIGVGDIAGIPPMGHRTACLFRGLYADATGRQNLVLDAVTLRNEAQFHALARLREAKADDERGTPGSPTADGRSEVAFLLYYAGGQRASRLTQISEILPLGDSFVPFGVHDAALLGLLNHRGTALPVVCLATALGEPARLDPRKGRILVVQEQGLTVGFAVEELRSIETPRWEVTDSEQKGAPTMLPALLTFGDLSESRLVAQLDLVARLRLFAGVTASQGCEVTLRA
jgi:purine-binding chemotaxis protein CheW